MCRPGAAAHRIGLLKSSACRVSGGEVDHVFVAQRIDQHRIGHGRAGQWRQSSADRAPAPVKCERSNPRAFVVDSGREDGEKPAFSPFPRQTLMDGSYLSGWTLGFLPCYRTLLYGFCVRYP